MSPNPAPSTNPPTLLVAVDHRRTISLNGEWHTIVDLYGNGLYTFHGKLRTDGYFKNGQQAPGSEPLEYDFQKSPVLDVPRDWNTQRESLFFYEGPNVVPKGFFVRTQTGSAGVSSCGRGELPVLCMGKWAEGMRSLSSRADEGLGHQPAGEQSEERRSRNPRTVTVTRLRMPPPLALFWVIPELP